MGWLWEPPIPGDHRWKRNSSDLLVSVVGDKLLVYWLRFGVAFLFKKTGETNEARWCWSEADLQFYILRVSCCFFKKIGKKGGIRTSFYTFLSRPYFLLSPLCPPVNYLTSCMKLETRTIIRPFIPQRPIYPHANAGKIAMRMVDGRKPNHLNERLEIKVS